MKKGVPSLVLIVGLITGLIILSVIFLNQSDNYVTGYTVEDSLIPGEIDSCGVLDDENGVYTLNTSITGITGTCFNITGNGITLDFAGYNITGDDTGEDYGIHVNGYNDTTIKNGEIYDFSDGVYLNASLNNILLNCSYSTENVSTDSSLIRKWYADIQVNNLSGGLESANVNITDLTSGNVFSGTTSLTGQVTRQELIEYVNDGGVKTYHTPHTIIISKLGYTTNSTIYSLTEEQNVEHFVLLVSSTSDCGNEIIEIGEQCDDGNNQSGDGCSSDCYSESLIDDFLDSGGIEMDETDGKYSYKFFKDGIAVIEIEDNADLINLINASIIQKLYHNKLGFSAANIPLTGGVTKSIRIPYEPWICAVDIELSLDDDLLGFDCKNHTSRIVWSEGENNCTIGTSIEGKNASGSNMSQYTCELVEDGNYAKLSGFNHTIVITEAEFKIISAEYQVNSSTDVPLIDFEVFANKNLDFCKFTINNWTTNYSMALSGTNATYTDLIVENWTSLINETLTANFWCNDTDGEIAEKQIGFLLVDGNYTIPVDNETISEGDNETISEEPSVGELLSDETDTEDSRRSGESEGSKNGILTPILIVIGVICVLGLVAFILLRIMKKKTESSFNGGQVSKPSMGSFPPVAPSPSVKPPISPPPKPIVAPSSSVKPPVSPAPKPVVTPSPTASSAPKSSVVGSAPGVKPSPKNANRSTV